MEEIWKPINGFVGVYEVSNLGDIKTLERKVNNNGGIKVIKEKILAPKRGYRGYRMVSLRKNGTSFSKRVHSIVAEVFIPNPENKPCVNHIDNNTGNNSTLNLEWVTHKENMEHSAKQGRLNRGEKNRAAKLTEKDILEIRKSSKSCRELATIYRMSYNYMFVIKRGSVWKHL